MPANDYTDQEEEIEELPNRIFQKDLKKQIEKMQVVRELCTKEDEDSNI